MDRDAFNEAQEQVGMLPAMIAQMLDHFTDKFAQMGITLSQTTFKLMLTEEDELNIFHRFDKNDATFFMTPEHKDKTVLLYMGVGNAPTPDLNKAFDDNIKVINAQEDATRTVVKNDNNKDKKTVH